MDQICFITPEYPIEGDMTNTFVDSLICEFARQGIKCVVIAPFDVVRFLRGKGKYRKKHWKKNVEGSVISIYAPRFFGALGNRFFASLSRKVYNRVVLRKFKSLNKTHRFDAVYGHFFGTGGLPAEIIGSRFSIPSFVACGESSLNKLYRYEKKDTFVRCVEKITGVICVSTKNQEEIKNVWFDDAERWEVVQKKLRVIPNAFSPREFFTLEKKKAREIVGLPKDKFIVSFVGRFQEHKGIVELIAALNDCEDVSSVFLGTGPIKPECRNVLFAGEVNHDQIVYFLNASDVFVLPTKAEGCSNAIVEALACHLPVISSDLPFNYDVLKNDYNSLLVDPNSVEQIRKAILSLKNDPSKREQLSNNAGVTAAQLTLNRRVEKIVSFMEERIGEKSEYGCNSKKN